MTTPQPPSEPTKAQETPRTDKAMFVAFYGSATRPVVSADFARQLERELAAARAEVEAHRAITLSCGQSTVEGLKKAYLDEMHRNNQKDLPVGFDSWSAYHEHIIALRARLTLAEQETERCQGIVRKYNEDIMADRRRAEAAEQDAERLRGELAIAQILNETLRAQLSSRERIGNAKEQPGSAICAIEHWGWVQATFDAPHGWKVELLFKKDATDDLCDVGSHASAWHKSFVVAAGDALNKAAH